MTMDDNVLRIVDERMIDLLLLEAIHTEPEFRNWLFSYVTEHRTRISLVSARHSAFETSSGETDIEVVCETLEGHTIGLLFENKIYAPFMPRQLARYRERGEEGVRRERWQAFQVVLVAPRGYIDRLTPDERDQLDATLPYERILQWFAENRLPRYAFKEFMLEKAISSGKKGYVKQVDEAMTRFWRDYWQWLCASGSLVKMDEPPEKGRDSSWIEYRLPWEASKCRLYHKFKKGAVELVVACRDPELAEQTLTPLLEEGMEFRTTRSTAVVCIEVPKIEHRLDFDGCLDEVRVAVAQAERLLALALSSGFRQAAKTMRLRAVQAA